MRGGRLNTRTGTHAIWRNPPAAPNAIRFLINDVSLSLTNGGRELVFAGARISCRARPSASCQHGRTQVLVLSPATSDGVLSSARILLGAHWARTGTEIASAVPSADGATLCAG